MLKIFGPSSGKLCDGLSRREFLQVGALGMGGLALPQLLEAEARAGVGKSPKAVIMIYLVGAPPHQDMFDLKMDAPREVRGEFKPIKTNVPGIEICEHLPRMARIMDKLVPIRTMYGSPDGDHDSFICYTGRSKRQQPPGGWPSLGSVSRSCRERMGRRCRRSWGWLRRRGIRRTARRGCRDFWGRRIRRFGPRGRGWRI